MAAINGSVSVGMAILKVFLNNRQNKLLVTSQYCPYIDCIISKGCHLDVVRGPSTPHDPESDAGGSLSSWQGHPSR
jgi:hypothetical protein